ncbi:hypothetical protein GGX14DRAFT_575464 [Mycena pura]|uniref:Uncharacterized protein n=1 Tax=Mycena pura TaxID=153505 RepID=A0AAD6UVK6_9AGAR|nr:hypothetical protein GGX14DRAFT_575464 [Mycena pura]
MSSMNVRMMAAGASMRNRKSLALEAEVAGTTLDTTSESGENRGHRGYEYRSVTPPAMHATEEHLAEKWGLPADEGGALGGKRVTRSKRLTEPRLEETGSGMAGDSDVQGIEAIRDAADTSETPQTPSRESDDAEPSINDGALTAVGELEEGHLPAFDQNTLQINAAMRLRPYELEEYFIKYPKREYSSSDDSSSDEEQQVVLRRRTDDQAGWTRVGGNNLRRVKAEGAGAPDALVIKRSFFPDWFSADDELSSEDEDGEDSEPDSHKFYNITVPKLPAWKPIEINMFESIKHELSDNEDILELLSEEDSDTDDDANIQMALLESWKSSRAQGLDVGRRASESKVHVGVTIVELDDDGYEIEDTRTYKGSKRASKGKGIHSTEI